MPPIIMGKFHEHITESIRCFIEQQHLFFVATAPLSRDGHANVSPKGLDCFKVLGPNKVAYMDTLENGRITFMFCSFEKNPNILRLYGQGRTVLPVMNEWDQLSGNFTIYPSTRQIIIADITKIQTSCGYGIPLFSYAGERNIHFDWAKKKGMSGLEKYIEDNNRTSVDGLPTVIGKQTLGKI